MVKRRRPFRWQHGLSWEPAANTYLSSIQSTALEEMKHYGIEPMHMIRFEMESVATKVLDLTKFDMASKYGYVGGPIGLDTQALGVIARKDGYNVIRYYSERDTGKINDAIIDDYNDVLRAWIVTPVRI